MVLSTLLYGSETWTVYRRHIRSLDQFHIRHLRNLLGIKWQDKITNCEVLRRCECTGIEAILISNQLRWVGHVKRMSDDRIPKQLLYGELRDGKRTQGGQRKRYKDTIKHNLKACGIQVDDWESIVEDRQLWRASTKSGVELFEANRCSALQDKRAKRKARHLESDTAASSYVCAICNRDCHSRIGLYSHARKHPAV